jgi:hypothetical protein
MLKEPVITDSEATTSTMNMVKKTALQKECWSSLCGLCEDGSALQRMEAETLLVNMARRKMGYKS